MSDPDVGPEPGSAAPLPVLEVLPELRDALAGAGAAVLVAPPGTGKTTGVPPALLDEDWTGGGRIVVVQPRRLAARSAAARMAAVAGERVGATFGYSVRGDRKVGPATRVEMVTEGLLLRRLQGDPSLDGIAAVVLDEFHERSLDADLLLALLIDVRSSLREDLRILVMSATLAPGPVAELLAVADRAAPVITATAPMHPVVTHHRPGAAHERLEERAAHVIAEALATSDGDVLVFLPGRGEIRRTAERLAGPGGPGRDVVVHQLHGSVPTAEQDAALRVDPRGRRRVVLATSIAETSITVEGVRIVVDSGRRRTVRVHAATGLPGLVTEPVSMAGADQRRGRAGRTGPGTCYRLWSVEEERHRPPADRPEIADADLSPLLLQVLEWGARLEDLSFLDPPTGPHLEAAWELLADLGAIDDGGRGEARLTARGRALADLGFHPRLGAVVLAALPTLGPDGASDLAAVLELDEPGDLDLVERIRSLRRGDASPPLRDAVRDWRRRMPGQDGSPTGTAVPTTDLDRAVSAAVVAGYRDRLARRRPGGRTDERGREQAVYQLVAGGEVALHPADHPLARSRWLAVVGLDRGAGGGPARPAAGGTSGRAHLAVAVDDEVAAAALADLVVDEDEVRWDPGGREVVAVRRRRAGTITLDERPWRDPPARRLLGALTDGVATHGPAAVFDRWSEADELVARLAVVRQASGTGPGGSTPDPATSSTAGSTGVSAPPDADLDPLIERVAVGGRASRSDLARVDVARWLADGLAWSERQALDELAPLHLELPSGRRVRVRYGPDGPVVSTRLQDLLGTDEHPTVGGGRVPVVVELLSPAGRPLQRTADLPGFWRGSYSGVRSEMRGRYPKHRWPERPWD